MLGVYKIHIFKVKDFIFEYITISLEILELISRSEPFGVTREHRHFTNIVQAEIQHHNAFHAYTTTSMRWATISKSVNIGLDFFDI